MKKLYNHIYHEDLCDVDFILVLGKNRYSNFLKKKYGLKDTYKHNGGRTMSVFNNNTNKMDIVISLTKYINQNVYSYKALLVHELSHAVTMFMKEYNIEDDEYRSLLLEKLYIEFIPVIDKKIEESLNGKSK